MPSPVNILYLHSHDTGRYIQPYGHPVHTPKLQKFAEESVLFRQAFCAAPTCSPSRAALLTGTWPHVNGMIGLAHRGAKLHKPGQHLANVLRSCGYDTALCGIQHEAHGPDGPRGLGYDEVIDGGKEQHGWAEAAVKWLQGRCDADRPFFLSVGFFATHRRGPGVNGVQWHNHQQSPSGDPRYVRPPITLPDTPETRADFADFGVAVQQLDDLMGQVLQGIDAAKLRDRTLVIVTTDHGIAYPRMKCNLTDHGIGVMLMLRAPRHGLSGGKVIDAMVSHLDVFPTICELTGLPRPAWLEGHSLMPLVTQQTESIHEELFAEVSYHAAYEPMRAIRTARYKYIRRWDGRARPVLPNVDPSVSKNTLLQAGWNDRAPDAEQLYDLTFDPGEYNNLAADPDHVEIRKDLAQRLEQWMQRTNDPLLSGHVPPQPGMLVNDPDGQSPDEQPRPAA
jgi:arylsulfatase A-like enzyme